MDQNEMNVAVDNALNSVIAIEGKLDKVKKEIDTVNSDDNVDWIDDYERIWGLKKPSKKTRKTRWYVRFLRFFRKENGELSTHTIQQQLKGIHDELVEAKKLVAFLMAKNLSQQEGQLLEEFLMENFPASVPNSRKR